MRGQLAAIALGAIAWVVATTGCGTSYGTTDPSSDPDAGSRSGSGDPRADLPVAVDGGGSEGGDGAADGAPDKPQSCTLVEGDCGFGRFCESTDATCTTGTCQPVPAADATFAPVCGCNGSTYWNLSLAAAANAATRAKGECTGDARSTCAASGAGCVTGVCGHELASASACGGPATLATCWVLPPICNASDASNGANQCNAVACLTLCNAIKTGTPFYRVPCMTD